MKNILLIGGGGHCKSVLDTLLDVKDYSKIGIIDKVENIGKSIMGVPIIGCDNDLKLLFKEGYEYAFVTVGSIGYPVTRIKLFTLLSEIGFTIPIIIDDSAVVSKYAKIERGVFVGKKSVINVGAFIQEGAIINSGSIIEHDCQIGAHSHIAPGAVLSGDVIVGKSSHIGTNSSVKQQVSIGTNSIIGIGSVVLKDINSHTIAYGNPCKEVKKQ